MTAQDQNAHKQHFTLQGDSQTTALELLHAETAITKQQLKQFAAYGAIWLKPSSKQKPQRLRRLKKIVGSEQTLDFYYNPELLNQEVTAPTLIDDQQQYSVWLKPRGMLSQGSKWADHTALYRWVELNYQPSNQVRQCWIVHRLDRATCGLMLLAHSKSMAQKITALFESKQVRKTYKTMVWGQFPPDTQTITSTVDDKPATSHIQLIKYDKLQNISQVEVKIETGRKHQIRRHLSENGFPIIGDRLYGDSQQDQRFQPLPDLLLTAYQLSFECPISGTEKAYKLADHQLDLIEPDTLELDHGNQTDAQTD